MDQLNRRTFSAGLLVALALAGCARGPAVNSKQAPSTPAAASESRKRKNGPAVRRARAEELVDAANSGVIPSWFSPAEVEAVHKIGGPR